MEPINSLGVVAGLPLTQSVSLPSFAGVRGPVS